MNAGESTSKPAKILREGTKRYNVLKALLDSGEDGIDCFQAVWLVHDFVLRSTISEIQSGYGLAISRRPHVVQNGFGGETHCARYWLDGPARKHAARLLGVAVPDTVH